MSSNYRVPGKKIGLHSVTVQDLICLSHCRWTERSGVEWCKGQVVDLRQEVNNDLLCIDGPKFRLRSPTPHPPRVEHACVSEIFHTSLPTENLVDEINDFKVENRSNLRTHRWIAKSPVWAQIYHVRWYFHSFR